MTAESTWIRRRIGDFAKRLVRVNVDGKDLPPFSVTKGNGVMLQSEKYNKRIATDPRKYVLASQGEFIYDPMSLYYGSVGLVPELGTGLASPDYVVFKTDDSVDARFLHYLLRSPRVIHEYQSLAEGGNQVGKRRRIYWSVLRDHSLLLPPLPEQQKIAAILTSVDEAVEATDAVIAQLQNVKKAMMAEMLTKGLPGRNTGHRWVSRRLDEVAHVQTGIAKGKAVENGVALPYLRVANVQDGYVDLGELKTIVVEANAIDRFALRSGDVLFTEGGDADKLGRGCVWEGQVTPCLHQNHVFAVRPDQRVLMPKFLAYVAASPRGKDYFLGCAKQTTNLASINSTQLRAFPVPLAPIDEQATIVEALSAVDNRLAAERITAQEVRSVKRALVSALLTGDLRVHPDTSGEAAA